MHKSLINCDIEITGVLQEAFDSLALTPICFYWNGSIPSEVVLTVKGSPKAYLGNTPEAAIARAEADIYRGL